MRVAVFADRCVGCRVCELVCSEYHEEAFCPSKARVQILSFDETVRDFPIVCQQCPDAPCIAVCPTGALHRDAQTDAVVVNRDLCIQCQSCIEACIIGNEGVNPTERLVIRFDEEQQVPIKCDLCGGDPQCVKYCPTQALILTDTSPTAEELQITDMTVVLSHFLRQEELPLNQKGD